VIDIMLVRNDRGYVGKDRSKGIGKTQRKDDSSDMMKGKTSRQEDKHDQET